MTTDVAIHLPNLVAGGAERVAMRLSNGFSARGYDVDIVLSQAVGPFINDISEDVSVVDLRATELPLYSALGSLPGLIRYLRDNEPTSLLSFLTRVNIVALLACRFFRGDTRLFVSEQNHFSSTLNQYGPLANHVLPSLVRRTYPWADGIVPVSEGVADDLSRISEIPASDMQVIYNPAYDPEIHDRAAEPISHPWFGPNEPPVIVAVGSLTQQKDFPTLLKAFRRVRSRVDARLIIAGEGPKRRELERLISQFRLGDCVDLPGFVENPFTYMSHADVFVLSSQWEGLPTVIVEALACGTPVVSTDCPSGPAEILQQGEYGRLVPIKNPQALAEAVDRTLSEAQDPESLVRRAQDFSVENVVDEYLTALLGK